MAVFEIIEAKTNHCGQICRLLRSEQRAAFKTAKIDAHREIRLMFEASFFRRAVLMDGSLCGLGGIAGTLMSSRGYVWLALSELPSRHAAAIVRLAMRELKGVMAYKTEIDATIVAADKRALRFALFLGFRPTTDHMEMPSIDVIPMRLGGGTAKWPIQ